MVAKAVGAETYREKPALSLASYTYWAGVPVDGGEVHALPRRAVGAWPTNDGLLLTYIAWPIEEFESFRRNIEGNVLATLDLTGDLGERVRAGRAGGNDAIVSPMQGTVLSVAVADGDVVEAGQVICIVEAMKMENEIHVQRAGRVTQLSVAAGEPVATGQVICVVEA